MMTRKDILKAIRPFFDIEELVCDHVYAKWGESSWQFLDTQYLHCLLVIRRDIIRLPMWCNGNNAHQRGLRCNICQLVKEKKTVYESAHILGKAGDFTISGMKAEAARNAIIQKKDLLPYPIRMEKGVNWLHFDVRSNDASDEKVTLFNG